MKNKKGITFGRVLLYILLCFLFLSIIWILVLTYREIAKNPNTTTKIECDPTLKMQDDVEVPVNLFNSSLYPFYNRYKNGNNNTNFGFTGCFTLLNAGSYTLSFNNIPSGYTYLVFGSVNPSFNVDSSSTFETSFTNNTSTTFTFSTNLFFGILFYNNSSTVNVNTLNSLDIMLNEGSSAQNYVPFNQNYQNANSYISYCYFTGSAKVPADSDLGGYAWPYCYVPVVATPNLDYNNMGSKTYYNISSNSNILDLGSNVSELYTNIYNSTYNFWYYGYHFTNISYSSTFYTLTSFYDCSTPIPIYLFNFDLAGSDLLLNSDCVMSFICNDDIKVSVHFSNLDTFTYDLILNVNPNIRSIYSFSFSFYFNTSIESSISTDSLFLQNKSWSTYKNNCYFYLVFKNFFGDSDWVQGYNEGYREGLSAAEESLKIAYNNAMTQVNDLTSQVTDLTSRVNSQSNIIENLQNQINNVNLGFKNFFFTLADVPFKTVSNVLGFEVFGLNLFQFFTGILTALGCIWLIKKFL